MRVQVIFAVLSFIGLPGLILIRASDCKTNCTKNNNHDLTNRVHYRSSANDKYYRFMVELFVNNKHICAGVIIDGLWIVTAAHCLSSQPCTSLVIKHSKNYQVESSVNIYPIGCYPHENFDSYTRANDIGLIKVPVNLLQSGKMEAVVLPNSGMEYPPNEKAMAIGWGRTDNGYITAELVQGNVFIGDSERCKNSLKISGLYQYLQSYGELPKEIMCTYEVHANQPGTCLADSGGPILVGSTLVGILSSGVDVAPYQACNIDIAHIEVNVVQYLSWIYARIDPYSFWNPGYIYDYDSYYSMDEERR